MTTEVHTTKEPGELVLGEGGRLYIIDEHGRHQRHELPHRRDQRERAEASRARIAANFEAMNAPRPFLSLFRRSANG